MDIFGIIGAVAGVISLLTVLYFAVYWKAGVDADRKAWRDTCEQYPPAELWTMTKTMWQVYVVQALQGRPDLAEHHSAFKLKPEGHDIIPDDIKQELDNLPTNPGNKEGIATGYLVVKFLGVERVSKMAEQKGLSLQEAVAVLSTYLDEKNSQA